MQRFQEQKCVLKIFPLQNESFENIAGQKGTLRKKMKKKTTKQAQQDFTFAQLPHNRAEVFADCYKMRFVTILCLGLVMLLFCLPLFGVQLFTDIVGNSIYDRLLKGELTDAEATSSLNSLRVLTSVIAIPCWVCFAVGLSGVMRIIRQLAWGDPVFFFSDFRQGIKDSVGRFVAVFAICATLNFVQVFCVRWLSGLSVIAYAPSVLLVVVALPAAVWMSLQTVVYNVKFGKCFTNAIAFYGRTIFQTLGLVLLACAVWAVTLIASLMVKYIVFAVIVVLVLPAYLLTSFLFASGVFDKFLNKESFPDYYDKGVYRMDSPEK